MSTVLTKPTDLPQYSEQQLSDLRSAGCWPDQQIVACPIQPWENDLTELIG